VHLDTGLAALYEARAGFLRAHLPPGARAASATSLTDRVFCAPNILADLTDPILAAFAFLAAYRSTFPKPSKRAQSFLDSEDPPPMYIDTTFPGSLAGESLDLAVLLAVLALFGLGAAGSSCVSADVACRRGPNGRTQYLLLPIRGGDAKVRACVRSGLALSRFLIYGTSTHGPWVADPHTAAVLRLQPGAGLGRPVPLSAPLAAMLL